MGFYNVVNPSLLASGQPEDISQVLANLNAIAAVLNGGIDNTNVNGSAAIARSKLDFGAGLVNADIAAAAAIAATKLAAGSGATLGAILGADPVSGVMGLVGGVQRIGQVKVSSPQATIDFTSIPQSFTNLKLIISARATTSAFYDQPFLRYNNDSSSGPYSYNYSIFGANAGGTANVGNGEVFNASLAVFGRCTAANTEAGSFGSIEITIPDYSTSKALHNAHSVWSAQTLHSTGNLQGGTGEMCWQPAVAAAISRITLGMGGGNFAAGTVATLYGWG